MHGKCRAYSVDKGIVDIVASLESVLLVNQLLTRLHRSDKLTCAIAKMGISKQIKESTKAKDMCSGSVYTPTACQYPRLDRGLYKADLLFFIAFTATRNETAMPCQNEKNKIPLTQRNLAFHKQSLLMKVFPTHAAGGMA